MGLPRIDFISFFQNFFRRYSSNDLFGVFGSRQYIFFGFISLIYNKIEPEQIFYFKILLTMLTPLIFGALLIIFWIICKIYYKFSIEETIQKFLSTFFITLSFFLSSIITSLSEFISCTQIYEESYITTYLTEKCTNNPRYSMWRNFLVIPSFLIFAFFLPLFILFYMRRKRNQLFQKDVFPKISFLLNGYTHQTFYW